MKLGELLDGVDTLVSLPDVFVRVNDLLEDPRSNASDIGAELMRRWRLPASLWEPVEHQYSPADAGEHSLEAAILNIAVGLTNRVEPEFKTDGVVVGGDLLAIDPRAWKITGLSEEDAETVVGPVNLNCIGVLEVINPAATLIF